MKIILLSIFITCLLCVFSSVGLAVYQSKKEHKKIGKSVKTEKQSHIRRLLFELPYQFTTDLYNRGDFEFFKDYSCLFSTRNTDITSNNAKSLI